MRGLRRLAAVIAAVAATAGCTTVVSPPEWYAKPAVSDYKPPMVDVGALLGDLTTLDPCSLFEPSDFGNGLFVSGTGFDECLLTLSTPGSTEPGVMISVGGVDQAKQFTGQRAPVEKDGFRTTEYLDNYAQCGRLVLFDDLALSAYIRRMGGGAQNQCSLLGAGFTKMLERLKKNPKQVKHRVYGKNSFGPVDPCRAMPSAGTAGLTVKRSWPTKHTCQWSNAAQTIIMRVTFGLYSSPTPPARPVTIAGRVTDRMEAPAGNTVHCILQYNHVKLPDEPKYESVSLVVSHMTSTDMAAACDQAGKAAEQLWAQLPPTS
ncbi:hypothetical protein V5P93_005370 [Actinokineospora auranticolor]|uniref:PknH-like protein n=1 Tax=Actinokineospora auranticolor TaxID=155976 RepID=A0A2S6GR03_9PSEU|nr:hypothetical protein [Actinokineospora auranticolor]PPK67603.1 hypothetical protein CLV40_107269 [Actinokineospora auranticolor]